MRDGKLVPADFNRAENFFRLASAVVRKSMEDRVKDEQPAVYGMAKESVRINRITAALALVRSLRIDATRNPDLLLFMDFDYEEGEKILEVYTVQYETKTLPKIAQVQLEDFYFTDQIFLKFWLNIYKKDIVQRLDVLGSIGSGVNPLIGVNNILATLRQIVTAMELVRELAECCYKDMQYVDMVTEYGQDNYTNLWDIYDNQIKQGEHSEAE